MKTLVQETLITETPRLLYKDTYANVSLIESVPCIRIKLNGVPQSSDHYQFVQNKLVEFLYIGKQNYFKLHLLTDISKAGLVLDEDMNYYNENIIPAIENAGIRYHAMILPENFFVRMVVNQFSPPSKKIHVEYFNSVKAANRWLRSQ
jgi:hypothetical protein